MSYQPAENLNNRTFVGLIVAQFLAGFNDQAIHAAAMFYAIHTQILSEASAITLMPILFYSPWAIFCTLAGYYADRYSKTSSLRVWKASEIVISLMLMAGFYFGSHGNPQIGGWLVMSCVFLMGTHAAFFAPAKYGAMPEVLRDHVLSRGNGILESTTFLASILGTVSGGLMYNFFRNEPVMIGGILLVLSIIGSVASFLIAPLPAASPEKPFPKYIFKPLFDNLGAMFRSRPLALAVMGIAFFVFMVSYMRASMYMHGETRNPRWDEQQTSLIVATVALGVGLGSPLAGYLSGGKIELGLVPLGCLGMIVALLASAAAIDHTSVLVCALIAIGFFSGYYMVPLYTLLQHRAKKSKGELVATSNFINVTGAIAASLLFNVLVQLGRVSGVTPEIETQDRFAAGTVVDIKMDEKKHGRFEKIIIQTKDKLLEFEAKSKISAEDRKKKEQDKEATLDLLDLIGIPEANFLDEETIDFDENFFDSLGGRIAKKDQVIVSTYNLRGVRHYLIRKDGQPLKRVFDNESLPKYLFLGAALMTIGILILLCRKLPDFFTRMFFWLYALKAFRLKAVGMHNLPTEGPVVLVTNCTDLKGCLQLVSATDRTTKVLVIDDGQSAGIGTIVETLARRSSLLVIATNAGTDAWQAVQQAALRTLQDGHLLAVCVAQAGQAEALTKLVSELKQQTGAPLVPVYCGAIDAEGSSVSPRVRVVFGEAIGTTPIPDPLLLSECQQAIEKLHIWIRDNDVHVSGAAH